MLLTARASRTFLGVSLLSAKSSFAWTLPTAKTGVCKILRRASSSPNDSAVDFGNEFKDMAPSSPPSLTVVQMPCLTNNYGYLIHDDSTGYTAAIDVPEAKRYQEELGKRNWKLTHIFNTHHHFDHTGGNMELKGDGVVVYGPHSEQIPGRDVALKGGDEIEFGTIKGQVMDVGGHTKGHIAYYFPSEDKVFVGDALFALGCGRMFEGTPDQFWTSLKRLRDLPDETEVFWYVLVLKKCSNMLSLDCLGIDLSSYGCFSVLAHTNIHWTTHDSRKVSSQETRLSWEG